MGSERKSKRNKALLIGAIAILSLFAYILSSHILFIPNSILPQSMIVPLTRVVEFFPEMIQEVSSGINLTAVGNPKATRSVIYANRGNTKKVTITVDQYESLSEALSAYEQAIQKSKIPGFKPLVIPKIGQQSFAGTVTKDGETHIGLGVLNDNLVLGLTLAGYEITTHNLADLVSLAREEETATKSPLNQP